MMDLASYRRILLLAAAHLGLVASSAWADVVPLEACGDAAGSYLTRNSATIDGRRSVVGRSLITLTKDGQVFLTDSNEAGIFTFAPFTDGQGTWRCVADRRGRLHVRAIVLDFTEATADPEQRIGRVDYDLTYHARTDTLRAKATLAFAPIDGDPLDRDVFEDPFDFSFRGTRVTPTAAEGR